MTEQRRRRLTSLSLQRLVRLICFLCVSAGAARSYATGYYGPTAYLDEGGRRVTQTPEFYWDLEVKRLARDFHPPEKLTGKPLDPRAESIYGDAPAPDPNVTRTADADVADFAAAMSGGQIKPPNPTEASQQHEAARQALATMSSEQLPGEFASEFADYHRGAFAFRKGAEAWPDARREWEALLARPAPERHYRSVWAAFMLGKLALKTGDFPAAAQWLQRTRAMASEGFADSLGMAADSYGWEGRAEWKQGHAEQAARMFLTQLALGDESAVVSLKALVPDRTPVEGLLNYGPEYEERQAWDEATARAFEQKELEGLRAAARSPLLQRLVTTHILATQSDEFFHEDTGRPAVPRAARWLAAVQEANAGKIQDAEYLGWIAYHDGKYDQAKRWLTMSGGNTPAALWLQSKLEQRAGKLDQATATMARAWEVVRNEQAYTGWKAADENERSAIYFGESGPNWTFSASASGDLGGLRLARAEFVAALDALLKGRLWSDAAYVAERVLTTNELKTYVDQQPPDAAPADAQNGTNKLRYLLGRRLVREDRYADAAPYLPPRFAKLLETYVASLNGGAATGSPKAERAKAYFAAAWIARYGGMELMGTEGAPDGFETGGDFEAIDLAQQRQAGTYTQVSYTDNSEKQTRVPVALKATAKEKERLAKNKIRPDVRWHYRVVAGALALRAAELLPDNSDELADVLNRAGLWLQERDQKMAERCYTMIERRCSKTTIGRAAIAKHWFVSDASGAWSEQQRAAYEALVPPENGPDQENGPAPDSEPSPPPEQ